MTGSVIKLGVEPFVEVLLKEKRVVIAISMLKPDVSADVQQACDTLGIKVGQSAAHFSPHACTLQSASCSRSLPPPGGGCIIIVEEITFWGLSRAD